MISRRRFLIGAGATVLVAGVGGAALAETRPDLLHRVGLSDSPDRFVPPFGDAVVEDEFTSAATNGVVRFAYTMPAHAPARATVFVLHGRGDNERTVFDRLRLHDFVASARLPLAVASVNGGESYWHQRADGTDTMAMVIQEFIPRVEKAVGTSRRFLYGWSMGGYGSLLAASEHPGQFGAVAALSPALWTRAGDSAPGAFDNADDFGRHDVFSRRAALTRTPVRISCGTGDPFYAATRAFVKGWPSIETDFAKGFHDDAYWRSVSPSALAFLARHI